jgi:hypothetical protein
VAGPVWENAEYLASTRIRPPGLLACCKSLCHLRYPGPHSQCYYQFYTRKRIMVIRQCILYVTNYYSRKVIGSIKISWEYVCELNLMLSNFVCVNSWWYWIEYQWQRVHGSEVMLIHRIIPTSGAQLQYGIMSHNRVSTDTELSTVTPLRKFSCSEKFTVHVFCLSVQIQDIFQVTPKQKDIHWRFLPTSSHGNDSINKQSSN